MLEVTIVSVRKTILTGSALAVISAGPVFTGAPGDAQPPASAVKSVSAVERIGRAGQAAPPKCSPDYHCYAVVTDGVDPNTGASADLYVHCLGVSHPKIRFANWEIWDITSDDGETWVESGQHYGTFHSLKNKRHGDYVWFWAQQNTRGSYSEHYVMAGTGPRWVHTALTTDKRGIWTITQASKKVGSTKNNLTGVRVQGGAEVIEEPGSTLNAYINNLQARQASKWWNVQPFWKNNSGGWLHGLAEDGTKGAWTNAWTKNCYTPTVTQPPSGTPFTATSVPAALKAAALQVSAANGEHHPSGITFVRSPRNKEVAALSDSDVPGDDPSYLVQLHGHFTGATASVPPGGKTPAGTTLTIIVNAHDGEITDWGISSGEVPLSSLGAVHTVQ